MPKSKSRKKPSKQRYNLHPHRKQRSKASPAWFAPVMVAMMAVGVAIIVWNFFRPNNGFNAGVMWLGLGFIAGGFFGISFWK
jgi:cell division protein CrgA